MGGAGAIDPEELFEARNWEAVLGPPLFGAPAQSHSLGLGWTKVRAPLQPNTVPIPVKEFEQGLLRQPCHRDCQDDHYRQSELSEHHIL
jgi:hypothetical protein